MITHDILVKKLQDLYPTGALWILTGNTYNGLNWLDLVISKPTPEQLGL